jgi:chemotaxis family two-component system response regulator Rcp1
MPLEILLIEDNSGDIRLTREAFGPVSKLIKLHAVSDGAAAMAFLRQQEEHTHAPRPDIILLDLDLPLISGRVLLSLIKKDSSLQSIPVFVVTASESEEDEARSLRDGAEEYLRKPVMWQEFEGLVKSVQDFWKTKVNLQSNVKEADGNELREAYARRNSLG